MNSKRVLLIIIGILFTINITLLVKFGACYTIQSSSGDNKNLTDDNRGSYDYINLTTYMMSCQIKYNGLTLPEETVLITSGQRETSIIDLVHKFPILIVDLRMSTCKICVDDEIARLKTLTRMIGPERVILLYESNSFRNNRAFETENNINIYSTPTTSQSPLPQPDQSCCYVVDEELQIMDFLILSSTNEEITEEYLNLIREKYF